MKGGDYAVVQLVCGLILGFLLCLGFDVLAVSKQELKEDADFWFLQSMEKQRQLDEREGWYGGDSQKKNPC